MEISPTTRRLLIDELRLSGISYSGALSEIEFLERLYDLDGLPSTDGRPQYENLRDDIQQHRVSWPDDYGSDWQWKDERLNLLRGSDENLLAFLSEMVHPIVRRQQEDVDRLLEIFNRHLRVDGYEIVSAGQLDRRPVYRARRIAGGVPSVIDQAGGVPDLGEHVRTQIDRMRSSMASDPSLAIGTAKEMVETVCKTVLKQRGAPFEASDEAPRLARLALDAVAVVPAEWKGDPSVEGAIKSLVGSLIQAVTRLAELRNKAGTGHGRDASAADLDARHARLAVDAAATFAIFLLGAVNGPPVTPTR